MSDNHGSDSDDSVPFFVDLKAHVRDDVSISSVDSEPLVPHLARVNGDGEAVPSSSDEDLEDGAPNASTTGARRESYTAESLGVNIQEFIAAVTEADRKVPVERLSEAPVAQVSSLSSTQRTIVAEGCDEAVALDAGTHLCLADGTLVGLVVSTFGPVRHAFYVLASPLSADAIAGLQRDELLKEETSLHIDLGHQTMIFDPTSQCDVFKGTDASYVNDEELPEHVRPDFSDDEKELSWKRQRRLKRSRSESISSDDTPEDIDWNHIELEDPAPPPPNSTAATNLIIPTWLQQ